MQFSVTEDVIQSSGFHWTLRNLNAAQVARRRTNSKVRADLASPEDLSLEAENPKPSFNAYGTTV